MSDATGEHDGAEAVRSAAAEYRSAAAAIEAYDRDQLESTRQAYDRATSLLRQFEDKATGTGAEEFVRTAQIRSGFANHVEDLEDDLPGREAFENAADAIDKRRLSESDFERARERLGPVEDLVDRLDEYERAREALKSARIDARERLETVTERIDELERLRELAEVESEVDLAPLREPTETYNRAVRAAFESLQTNGSTRELFDLIERAQRYPLVSFDQPPEELQSYVHDQPAGEESLTQLLEYAEFSRSKLAHYVEDADRLKRRVATQRTYLERLDAGPLTVGWPPPEAEVVPWRTRALRTVAGPLIDEEAAAALRRLEALARDREAYERLRTAAAADAQLSDADRERLASGEVGRELQRRRDERDAIETALEETPAIEE